jgi:hypothetical protein
VAEHDPSPPGTAERLDPVQALRQGGAAGEVEPFQEDARRGRVHVCVDECRGHQAAVEVDHLVGTVSQAVGRVLAAEPADRGAIDEHGGRAVSGVERGAGKDRAVAVERGRHRDILPSKMERTPGSVRTRSKA